MDLRVFFYRKFVAGQGRKGVLRENFLKKMRKSKKKERAFEGGMRQTEGTRVDGKKHLLCYIENVGANIVRPPTWCSKAFPGRPCT